MHVLGFTEDEIDDELGENSRAQRESEKNAAGPGEESGTCRHGSRAEDAPTPQRDGKAGFDIDQVIDEETPHR